MKNALAVGLFSASEVCLVYAEMFRVGSKWFSQLAYNREFADDVAKVAEAAGNVESRSKKLADALYPPPAETAETP